MDFFNELRVGCYVLMKDVIPVGGKQLSRWVVKQLDGYWLQCVFNFGKGWTKPICLTGEIIGHFAEIEPLDECGEHFHISCTPFNIVTLYDGTYSVETDSHVGISRAKYLHQLQNVFYDITGVMLESYTIDKAIRRE